jgi:hypothetical protein
LFDITIAAQSGGRCFHIASKYQRRRLTVTEDAYYKIGVFILVLFIITWMFLPNSWGAESRERRSPDNLTGILVDRNGDG